MADGMWLDEVAYFVGAAWWPRRCGKLTAQRAVFEQAANAGEHVHQVSPNSAICANGDDLCPVWRSQQ